MVNDCGKLKMFSPENEIFLWIKRKKKKKFFCGKSGSMPTFRSTRKGKKRSLWWAYVCLTTRCYTASHLHQVFLDFARIFSLFSLVYRTLKFWSLRNLIRELFHSRLLDMRLLIADGYSLGYELVTTISYPTRAHGIIVKYTIMGNPIKSLELYYPMMKFLINGFMIWSLFIFLVCLFVCCSSWFVSKPRHRGDTTSIPEVWRGDCANSLVWKIQLPAREHFHQT